MFNIASALNTHDFVSKSLYYELVKSQLKCVFVLWCADMDGGSAEVDVSGEHLPGRRHPCPVARGGQEI